MKPLAIILIIATALLLTFSALALAQNRIVLVEEESSLWIEGTSTIDDIFCKAGVVVGYADIGPADASNPDQLKENGSVRLNIPVMEFDCGQRRMNRDFFSALQAEEHPEIQFSYSKSQLITNLEPECHPFQLKVDGTITVAGTDKDITVMVDIEPCEYNRFRLKGKKTINMKDFGIEPPRALFGLIRAHEELEVHFSLTAKQKNGGDNIITFER